MLKVRGEKLAATRARIVEAAMRLHEEVGPRHTTISAIAARAGVERLTVYRHFPDEAAVFAACSRHYQALNPPPDPAAWARDGDPRKRTQTALRAVYGYFRRTARMLEQVYRDAPEFPALRAIMDEFDGFLGGIADDLAATWPRIGAVRARKAILRHAVRFQTWQSLEREKVADDAKADLIVTWLEALQ